MDTTVLLAFPLLLALSTPCSACRCKIEHPQTFYCRSDIVILADILGPGNDTKRRKSFKISSTTILKAPRGITQIENIYTPIDWSDCGFSLNISPLRRFLLAGYLRRGKMIFTACHLIYSWIILTKQQRVGFKGAYRAGCKCEIRPCLLCTLGCPEPDSTQCVWKQRNCEYDYWTGNNSLFSMCVPSKFGHCEWTRVQTTP